MTRRAGCAMNGVEVLLGSFIIKPFRFSPFLFPGADSNPTSSGNWAEASPIIFARQSRNCSVLKRTDKLLRNESHRGLFRIARFSNWKTLFWHSRIAESSVCANELRPAPQHAQPTYDPLLGRPISQPGPTKHPPSTHWLPSREQLRIIGEVVGGKWKSFIMCDNIIHISVMARAFSSSRVPFTRKNSSLDSTSSSLILRAHSFD